jgi:D-sedoheptulose 7-phosphate isomerase
MRIAQKTRASGHADRDAALAERIARHFADSANLKLAAAPVLAAPVAQAVARMVESLRAGGKILACGNGGSAADAQHFAAELVNRFEVERGPLAALALTTDTSALTSIANDYRFEEAFAKPLRALGRRGDVLLAITTSGNSGSVLEAVRAAHEVGARVVALTGNRGGRLAALLGAEDVHICVPHAQTARIQEVHGLVLHCLCDGIDFQLYGTKR